MDAEPTDGCPDPGTCNFAPIPCYGCVPGQEREKCPHPEWCAQNLTTPPCMDCMPGMSMPYCPDPEYCAAEPTGWNCKYTAPDGNAFDFSRLSIYPAYATVPLGAASLGSELIINVCGPINSDAECDGATNITAAMACVSRDGKNTAIAMWGGDSLAPRFELIDPSDSTRGVRMTLVNGQANPPTVLDIELNCPEGPLTTYNATALFANHISVQVVDEAACWIRTEEEEEQQRQQQQQVQEV
jgi:hypothetical protein